MARSPTAADLVPSRKPVGVSACVRAASTVFAQWAVRNLFVRPNGSGLNRHNDRSWNRLSPDLSAHVHW